MSDRDERQQASGRLLRDRQHHHPTQEHDFVQGSPENVPVPIGLLNAILKLAHPIVHIEMQVTVFAGRLQRLVYYACTM